MYLWKARTSLTILTRNVRIRNALEEMLYNLYDTIKNVYICLILLTFVILFFIVLKIVHLIYGSNSWYKSNINDIFLRLIFNLFLKKNPILIWNQMFTYISCIVIVCSTALRFFLVHMYVLGFASFPLSVCSWACFQCCVLKNCSL